MYVYTNTNHSTTPATVTPIHRMRLYISRYLLPHNPLPTDILGSPSSASPILSSYPRPSLYTQLFIPFARLFCSSGPMWTFFVASHYINIPFLFNRVELEFYVACMSVMHARSSPSPKFSPFYALFSCYTSKLGQSTEHALYLIFLSIDS